MSDEEILEPIQSQMKSAVAKLAEAGCESVLILCTISSCGGTNWLREGAGNSYAQWGSVNEYIIRSDEESRVRMRPVPEE